MGMLTGDDCRELIDASAECERSFAVLTDSWRDVLAVVRTSDADDRNVMRRSLLPASESMRRRLLVLASALERFNRELTKGDALESDSNE